MNPQPRRRQAKQAVVKLFKHEQNLLIEGLDALYGLTSPDDIKELMRLELLRAKIKDAKLE